MGFFSARLRRKAKRPDSRQSSNSPAVAEADAPASPAGAHDAAADAERSAEQIAAIAAALELASQRESKELNSDTLILASSEDQARLDALAQTYVPITAPEGQVRAHWRRTCPVWAPGKERMAAHQPPSPLCPRSPANVSKKRVQEMCPQLERLHPTIA